ncbi:hypothetical protein MMC09_001212 [Bachmanniomyces sp. S44760]|nr:hypothetical protein [Bachmanniomyces sp. S44760]
MTPGDFASLQEGREGLSTEDYIAWKLPEEEDPDDYAFPLTLRSPKKSVGPSSPVIASGMNGIGGATRSNGSLLNGTHTGDMTVPIIDSTVGAIDITGSAKVKEW